MLTAILFAAALPPLFDEEPAEVVARDDALDGCADRFSRLAKGLFTVVENWLRREEI